MSNISAFKLISINQEPADLFLRHFQSEHFKYVHVSFSQKVVKYWSCASNAFFQSTSFGPKDFFLTYRLQNRVIFIKKVLLAPSKQPSSLKKIDGNNEFLKRVLYRQPVRSTLEAQSKNFHD